MKRLTLWVLLAALLCGCAAPPAPPALEPASSEESAPQGFYDPDSALESSAPDALRLYPLEGISVSHVQKMGEDLLVVGLSPTGSPLLRLTGDALSVKARGALPRNYDGLQVWEEQVSCYDMDAGQVLVLDGGLQELRRLDTPADMVGTPLLSRDLSTLFYCTADAIRALELESGISRLLKQTPVPEKTLHSLHLEESVLECGYYDATLGYRFLFLSAHTGATLQDCGSDLTLSSRGQHYFSAFPNGAVQSWVFGKTGQSPQALIPMDFDSGCHYLPEQGATVTLTALWEAGQTRLDRYDLETGQRTASITLYRDWGPWNFLAAGEDGVWLLLYDPSQGQDVLCLWDTKASPVVDPAVYTHPYYSADAPDLEGLAQCQTYAEKISAAHGVQIKIWKDAAAQEPWDYDLEPEYRADLTMRELTRLDQRLCRYPEGFLRELAFVGKDLSICLVRSIRGSAQSGSLDSANGIQFWEDDHGFVVLAMGSGSEAALYHELCHIIDAVVLSYCDAYDGWDALNPGDFEYDYDYIQNQSRESWEFLQPHSQSFIDMYSMSYPKEDRARIMEYAMLEGNQELFQAPVLQKKLETMCIGIREAFRLESIPTPLPWEQYLQIPITPEAE